MTASQERVLEMVARGEISSAEGDELLRAMAPAARRPSVLRRLVDPLESAGAGVCLSVGAAAAVASGLLATLGVRFDGALDVHVVEQAPDLVTIALDQLVAFPLFAAILFGAARLGGGANLRFADFLGFVGVARVPLLLLAGASLLAIPRPVAQAEAALAGQVDLGLLFVGLLALPLLGWLFVWLVTGYRTGSGLRGARLTLSFLAAVVVGEVASKVLLWALGL